MNVLITAASSAQAYKLEKELSYADSITFADAADLPQVVLKDRKFIKIPECTSQSLAHQLLTVCLDLGIDEVFPLRKAEIEALAEARQLFDEYNIKVMVPAQDSLSYCFGNSKTGKLIIKSGNNSLPDAAAPDRGAFLFNPGAKPEYQILTAD